MNAYELVKQKEAQIDWACEHWKDKNLRLKIEEKYGLSRKMSTKLVDLARNQLHSKSIHRPVEDIRYDLYLKYNDIIENGSMAQQINAAAALRKMLNIDVQKMPLRYWAENNPMEGDIEDIGWDEDNAMLNIKQRMTDAEKPCDPAE